MYHILWVEDKPDENVLAEVKEVYSSDLDITCIGFRDIATQELENNPDKYHAVIFDANVPNSSSPGNADKKGFLKLIRHTLDKRLLVFVYSGQLDRANESDQADTMIEELEDYGLYEGEQILFKYENDYYDLFAKVKDALDAKNNLYVGYEYLLSFFQNGWIGTKYKDSVLTPLMRQYKEKDIDSSHGNYMRIFVEQMLERVNTELKLGKWPPKEGERARKIVDVLWNKYPTVAKFMRGPLTHMVHMPNEESHDSIAPADREYFFQSDYSTFFLVTHWFHGFMLEYGEAEKEYNASSDNTSSTSAPPKDEKEALQPEAQRPGMYVKTRKVGNKTFFDAEVEVCFANPEDRNKDVEPYVTGIRLNKTQTGWCTYPVNTVRDAESVSSSTTFKLSDIAKIKSWKK